MSVKRRRHSPDFKFRVALEAAKEQQTISQLASKFSLHPTQISDWKKQLLEKGKTVFQPNGKHKLQVIQESELYEQIGRLKMELEWLKKNSDSKRMIHDDEGKNMRCRTLFGNPLKYNALRCRHHTWLEAVTDHFFVFVSSFCCH